MKSCLHCAAFGQNPMRFPWRFDEEDTGCRDIKMELLQQVLALRCSGVTQFSVACDYGVGLYAAEQINILRENDSALMLFCTMPYEEQAKKWTPYLRERYFDMLTKCTYMNAVSLHEQPEAQLLAYRQRNHIPFVGKIIAPTTNYNLPSLLILTLDGDTCDTEFSVILMGSKVTPSNAS